MLPSFTASPSPVPSYEGMPLVISQAKEDEFSFEGISTIIDPSEMVQQIPNSVGGYDWTLLAMSMADASRVANDMILPLQLIKQEVVTNDFKKAMKPASATKNNSTGVIRTKRGGRVSPVTPPNQRRNDRVNRVVHPSLPTLVSFSDSDSSSDYSGSDNDSVASGISSPLPNNDSKGKSTTKKTNKSHLPTEERQGWAARVTSKDSKDKRFVRLGYTKRGRHVATGSDIQAILSGVTCVTKADKKKASLNTTRLMTGIDDSKKCVSHIGSKQVEITVDDAHSSWWSPAASHRAGSAGGNGRVSRREEKKVDGGRGQGATCVDYRGLLDILGKKAKKKDTVDACNWLRTNLLPVLRVTEDRRSFAAASLPSLPLSPNSPSSDSSNDGAPWL
jgi:hypothetical protein